MYVLVPCPDKVNSVTKMLLKADDGQDDDDDDDDAVDFATTTTTRMTTWQGSWELGAESWGG